MRKIILPLFLSVFLVGCFSFGGGTSEIDDVEQHPPRPDPVQPHYVEWEVITKENASAILNGGDVFIGMEYQDGLEFFKFMEDVKRYILEINQNECFYRESLEEEVCKNQEKFLEMERGEDQLNSRE